MTTAPNAASTEATPELIPDSPEYREVMIARFRRGQDEEASPAPAASEAAAPTRPDHVPEKFWNAEKGEVNVDALLKSYSELEKVRSGGEKPVEEKPAAGAAPTEDAATDDAQKAVESAGLDWDTLTSKVAEKGAIDETDYEALAKAGVPKQIVDNYLAMVRERADRETADAIAYAGGQETLDGLMGWAAQNLNDAEKKLYNGMLASAEWRTAIDALKAKQTATSKTAGEPDLDLLDTSIAPSSTGYRSRVEMKRDMSDPRYRSDPRFREEVTQKVRFATWDLDR